VRPAQVGRASGEPGRREPARHLAERLNVLAGRS
jgi:hypothetical protein